MTTAQPIHATPTPAPSRTTTADLPASGRTGTVSYEIRCTEGRRTVQAEQLDSAPGLYLYESPADIDRDGPCRWRIGHHAGLLIAAFRTPDAARGFADAAGTWADWTLDADTLRRHHLGDGRDQAALDHLLATVDRAGGHMENCAAYGPYGC
ncbi:hypothetical protein ABTZ03_30955 [Kitasatospora sp. NPDC096077]|uniref:hypothetical protein n=1 Tax=Kitasatospora sp. NPDC096077 TaxID=3155544 RepID=UPI00332FB95E